MVNATRSLLGMANKNRHSITTRQTTINETTIYVKTLGFTAPYYEFYDSKKEKIESLILNGGSAYKFIALESMSSHPFQLNNENANVLNAKDSSFNITAPLNAITMPYKCTIHSNMKGNITVVQKVLSLSDYTKLGSITLIPNQLNYDIYKSSTDILFEQHYTFASTEKSYEWGFGIPTASYDEQKVIIQSQFQLFIKQLSKVDLNNIRAVFWQNGYDKTNKEKDISYAYVNNNNNNQLTFVDNTSDNTHGSYLLAIQKPIILNKGMVKYSNLEGGFHYISDKETGLNYVPESWENYESYKTDETPIRSEIYYVYPQPATTQQFGPVVRINQLDKREREKDELADFHVETTSSYNSEKNLVSIDLTNRGPIASSGYLDTNTDFHKILTVTKNIEESKDIGTLKAKTPLYVNSSDNVYYPESIVGLPSVGSAIENLTLNNEKYSVSMEHSNEFGLLINTTPLHESNDTITISFNIATDNNTFVPGKTYMFCADIPIADNENIGDTKEQVDTLNKPSNNLFVWTIPEPEPDSEYIEVQVLRESAQSDSIEGQVYNFFQFPVDPPNYHPIAIITNSNAEETIDLVLRKIDIATYDDDKYRPLELVNADGVVVQTLYASNNTMEYTLSVPPGTNTLRVHTDKVLWETKYNFYQVPPIIKCLKTTSKMNIINNNDTNYYVLNNLSTYDSSIKYGVYNGIYTITNIPESHPLAILNKNMESKISYSGDETKKITQAVNDDEYDFYHGSLKIEVKGDFDKASLYCAYHGSMGGEDLLRYTDNCNIQKPFDRALYEDFLIEVQALKDFINFEKQRADGSLIQRNIYNLDLFKDKAKSNPTYSVFIFQRELNIALKKQNANHVIVEDGFFGVNTAKAIQKLVNSYLPNEQKLLENGKIVSEIYTSNATAQVIDDMAQNNQPFVLEFLRFIDNHGTVQQHGVFEIATKTITVPYIDV